MPRSVTWGDGLVTHRGFGAGVEGSDRQARQTGAALRGGDGVDGDGVGEDGGRRDVERDCAVGTAALGVVAGGGGVAESAVRQ